VSASKTEGPEPRTFRSSDGLPILVGKSGPGNDRLTWRLARSHDLWLHAQGSPGSHVVVRLNKGKQAPPRTLREAAPPLPTVGRAGRSRSRDYALRNIEARPPPGLVPLTREEIAICPERDLVRPHLRATDSE
jgi:hypothetical protein